MALVGHWRAVVVSPLSPVHAAHAGVPVRSQVGVAPEQSFTFVDEHVPHAPLVSHAGAVVVGHARFAVLPLSPVHAAHAPAVSHVGVVPPHSERLDGEQTVHAPVG